MCDVAPESIQIASLSIGDSSAPVCHHVDCGDWHSQNLLFRNRYSVLFSKLLIFPTSTPMPPNIPPGRSLWIRLLQVIEQREEHILRVNSLIRQLGSQGILTVHFHNRVTPYGSNSVSALTMGIVSSSD